MDLEVITDENWIERKEKTANTYYIWQEGDTVYIINNKTLFSMHKSNVYVY